MTDVGLNRFLQAAACDGQAAQRGTEGSPVRDGGLGYITKHVNKSATPKLDGLMHHLWPVTTSRAGHLISCSV